MTSRAPSSAPPSERATDPARSARSAVGESPVEVSGRDGSHADDPAPEEKEEEEEEEEEDRYSDEEEASESEA